MAQENMFELALNEMGVVKEVIQEAKISTLEWVCRIGVAELKQSTPANTGFLKKSYGYSGPIEIYGKVVANIENSSEYASFEELGHRQHKRFVPGVWRNGRFFYNPNAKEGMMLSEKWVKGSFRLTLVAEKLNKMIPKIYEKEFTRIAKERGLEL